MPSAGEFEAAFRRLAERRHKLEAELGDIESRMRDVADAEIIGALGKCVRYTLDFESLSDGRLLAKCGLGGEFDMVSVPSGGLAFGSSQGRDGVVARLWLDKHGASAPITYATVINGNDFGIDGPEDLILRLIPADDCVRLAALVRKIGRLAASGRLILTNTPTCTLVRPAKT